MPDTLYKIKSVIILYSGLRWGGIPTNKFW